MIKFKTENKKSGLINLDTRTKLILLVLGTIIITITPGIYHELVFIGFITLLGVLCGISRFVLTTAFAHILAGSLHYYVSTHPELPGSVMIISFLWLLKKIFPCLILSGLLFLTTKVNELLFAMDKFKISRSFSIPLAVMIRYLPCAKEDFFHIKNAMKLRGVSPGIKGLITSPVMTVECIYVPMMMSASRLADELSAAAASAGIENPGQRSCITGSGFGTADFLSLIFFIIFLAGVLI